MKQFWSFLNIFMFLFRFIHSYVLVLISLAFIVVGITLTPVVLNLYALFAFNVLTAFGMSAYETSESHRFNWSLDLIFKMYLLATKWLKIQYICVLVCSITLKEFEHFQNILMFFISSAKNIVVRNYPDSIYFERRFIV